MAVDATFPSVVAVAIMALQATDPLVDAAWSPVVTGTCCMEGVGRMTLVAEPLSRIIRSGHLSVPVYHIDIRQAVELKMHAFIAIVVRHGGCVGRR
jgi:hypothetical protein